MSKGISNFQIDKFFKEQNENLQKNYMGTYSIDSISKYIDFYSIIKKSCDMAGRTTLSCCFIK